LNINPEKLRTMKKTEIHQDVQIGDVGLVSARSFLALAIKFFMNVYRKLLKHPNRPVYNHVFMVVDMWDKVFIAEALAKGISVRPWKESKYYGSSKTKLLRLKEEFNDLEKEEISKIAVSYALKPTRYDIFMFPFQIILTISGLWLGPKGKRAQRRLYCSEAVAFWINQIKPSFFEKPEATNLLDIDLHEGFREVDEIAINSA